MKTFLKILTVLILYCNISVAQEWQWQNPLPQGNNLVGVYFNDNNTGTVVGSYGTILKTTNGGSSWGNQSSGTTQVLYSASFPTEANTGTVVGAGGVILKTTNGGNNWVSQTSGITTPLYRVDFVNANTGTAVGSSGRILRTTDGGENWTIQTSGVTAILYGVSFINANTGFIAGFNSTILKTTNGGENWINLTSGVTANFYDVDYINENTATFVGTNHTIIKTTDGGSNWSIQNNNPGTQNILVGTSFSDANNGMAVGFAGVVYKTTNGGDNWVIQTSGTNVNIVGVTFLSSGNAIAIGGGGVLLKTTNGGNNWVNLASGTSAAHLQGISFANSYTGLAVGTLGAVMKTTNAGTNWTALSSGTSNDLSSISFVNATTGTAVGSGGTIIRTTDGGNSWNSQISGTDLLLNGVSFVDANTGTVVGGNPFPPPPATMVILRTTNGGVDWMPQTAEVTQRLNAVHFTDENTGTTVGGGGTILRTTNGGDNWSTQTSGTPQQLFGVFFIDANTGMVVGGGGVIRRTTNGGSNWFTQTTGTSTQFRSVHFINANTGTIVGTGGVIFNTTDGGNNWVPQTSGTDLILYGVTFPSDNVSIAVGQFSSILRMGEPSPPVNPNFGSNGQAGHNQYFFANSSIGASGAPSQPEFLWRDTTGSIDLYANGSNQASGNFTGNDDDGKWSILGQLGGGNIQFFGQNYTDVYIGNNGIIGFNAFNQAFPNSHQPPASGLNQGNVTEAIFPLWIDMNIGYTGVADRRICYKVTPSELIVTYSRVPIYAPSDFTNDPNRYVSLQVMIEFNNMTPTMNSNIFVSFDDTQSGSLFIDEVNNETLRTHLIGLQSANVPEQYLQYRYFSGTSFLDDGPIFGSPLTIAFGPDEDALPVDLISFTAMVDNRDVTLNWVTAWEENNARFDIQRRNVTQTTSVILSGSEESNSNGEQSQTWKTIGSVNGSGTTYESTHYTYTDKNLVTGKYEYRLVQIDYDGNSMADFELNNTVEIGVPTRFVLSQNYPNPFNPVTKINFEIPVESHVKLSVYDMTGREVATLVNNSVTPGYHTAEFNAVNFASGVYFYRLETANSVLTKRMLLLK